MRRSKEPPVTGQEEKVSIGSMKTSIFMVLNLLIKQRLAGLENSVVRLLRLLHLHLVSKHIKLSLTRLIQIRLRNKVAQIQEGKLSSVPSHSTKSLPSFRSLLLSPWFTRGCISLTKGICFGPFSISSLTFLITFHGESQKGGVKMIRLQWENMSLDHSYSL